MEPRILPEKKVFDEKAAKLRKRISIAKAVLERPRDNRKLTEKGEKISNPIRKVQRNFICSICQLHGKEESAAKETKNENSLEIRNKKGKIV